MKNHSLTTLLVLVLMLTQVLLYSQNSGAPLSAEKKQVLKDLDARTEEYGAVAQRIWQLAELGFLEEESTLVLQEQLRNAGFSMETGVADMPTSFIASWGSGKPVIGLLAEFDALPGLSQAAVPYAEKRPETTSGHGCGHHLFGTASVASAIALKDWLQKTGVSGTVRLYGTPAEEGGGGKVYMVRAGLFDDVDAVLTWHPGNSNDAGASSSLAVIGVRFRYYGAASHAAGAPERGRSALDGVEALNFMVNLMREHVPSDSRIHYAITHGGDAPNVVPAFAEVAYYMRNPEEEILRDIFDRILKAAEGAAMGTGTRMEYELEMGYYSTLPNEPLSRVMYENLSQVGGVTYNAEERAFAEKIMTTFNARNLTPESAQEIAPFEVSYRGGYASSDVGDISWVVPTASMSTATWAPGTPAHSWQAVACGGTSLGTKGMMVAAKTMALSAMDLFRNPSLVADAKKAHNERRGEGFSYQSLVGDRKPPLDYRKENR